MKFYGLAFAVIPKKDNPQLYSVTCTPIAMDQANQRSFEILDDLGNALNVAAPRNYASDQNLQEQLPRFGFYHWDVAFHDAFQEAYSQTHWRKGYLSVKLPLDPLNPFFTDVAADMIRSQFQIVEGQRTPEEYEDHNNLLQKVITPISNVVSQSSALPNH
jgi:hypothetical protein